MSNGDPTDPQPNVILVPVPVPVPQEGDPGQGGAALPTYSTVADVLEKKNGSGIRLAGWTLARTLLIGTPMMVVGVPPKQAFGGALLASALISVLTLERIGNASRTMGVPQATIGREPYRGRGHYR